MATRPRLPLGPLLAVLLALGAALLGGAATVFVGFGQAESQFSAVLDEKALSRAQRVRRDLELAVGLGIPLAEIRGMWDYMEQIPANDPDIRFVAVTDAAMQRLHYGGIGRERLDPLLADPRVARGGRAAGIEPEAVSVDGFSISSLPLLQDGEIVGFVHVAVQGKQLRERLVRHARGSLPLVLLALLLAAELAAFLYSAGHSEPLARLRRLLEAAARSDGSRFELSGRHAGGELGAAMFRFNALMHRLSQRADRFLAYAEEVRRAVFEAGVAAQVESLARDSELGSAAGAPRLDRRLDARRSDLWPPLSLAAALLSAILCWFLLAGEWAGLLPVAAAAALGLAAARLLLPTGLSLAGTAVLGAVALLLFRLSPATAPPAVWIGLALGAGLLGGAALRYARRHGIRSGGAWLALRLLVGGASGLLAAVSAERLIEPVSLAGLALLAGAGAMLLRPAVRRLVLAAPEREAAAPGSRGTAGGGSA